MERIKAITKKREELERKNALKAFKNLSFHTPHQQIPVVSGKKTKSWTSTTSKTGDRKKDTDLQNVPHSQDLPSSSRASATVSSVNAENLSTPSAKKVQSSGANSLKDCQR